jgi:hypothetical protein
MLRNFPCSFMLRIFWNIKISQYFKIFIIYSTISPGAPNGVGNTAVDRGRRIRDGRVFVYEGIL